MQCRFCNSSDVTERLDLGPQPISNRFLLHRDQVENRYVLGLGQCRHCGLVGLTNAAPASELRPQFEWITYNEPEQHLDNLTEVLTTLPGINQQSVIAGVSYKEDSTLQRFRERGYRRTWRIEPDADLGIRERAGIETIQDRLIPDVTRDIAGLRGMADILLARHILEHCFQPGRFLQSLKALVKPDGYIVFEVPDSKHLLEACDYVFIWEEHTAYFTTETLQRTLSQAGFDLVHFESYAYPHENSLVAIVKCGHVSQTPEVPSPVDEFDRFERFAQRFSAVKSGYRELLSSYRNRQKKIAVFGAGHLACAFINFYHLEELIDFVVDDHPKKIGLFMPGSRLPIKPSAALAEESASLCLLTLSPESERNVLASRASFITGGGRFASIFRTSDLALEAARE